MQKLAYFLDNNQEKKDMQALTVNIWNHHHKFLILNDINIL